MIPETTAHQGLSLEQWQDIAKANEEIDGMSQKDLSVLAKELYRQLAVATNAYQMQRDFFLPYYREAVIGDMVAWTESTD